MQSRCLIANTNILDNKNHGANMGPIWVLSAPGGPHVGPMNLAIRDSIVRGLFPAMNMIHRESSTCVRLPDVINSNPHTFIQHIHEDNMERKCFPYYWPFRNPLVTRWQMAIKAEPWYFCCCWWWCYVSLNELLNKWRVVGYFCRSTAHVMSP